MRKWCATRGVRRWRFGLVLGNAATTTVRIKVFYNGSKSPADDFPAKANGCYFKAGCYTQSNLSQGDQADAYGEVVIYELAIEHTP